jgi:hypothetical protein
VRIYLICLAACSVWWTRPGDKIVDVPPDGAANMTGSDRGVVSRIEREACHGFYRAWCGLNQPDIFVQRAVSKLCDDKFYGQLTAFIGYLHRQQIFIQEIASKCL